MATYIIVEDGSQVADSNSYVDVPDLLTYVDERGLSLSAASDHDYLENLLIRAAEYIEAQRVKYSGSKVSETQSLQFPRENLYIDGILIGNTTIPRELKYAQMRLAYDADKLGNVDLEQTVVPEAKGDIQKEKVGDIEKVYFNTGNRASQPAFTAADALLRPLYKNGGLSLFTRA